MSLLPLIKLLNTLAKKKPYYVIVLIEEACHGTEAVATERMYSRSLQDVARSIVRVEGVRR